MAEHVIARLLPRHYLILDLILDGNLTLSQMAEEAGVSRRSIQLLRKSPAFQHELAMRRKKRNDMTDELGALETVDRARAILEESSETAARKIVKLVGSPDDAIALRSAADLLDRAGVPKQTKVETESKGLKIVLTGKDLERIESTISLEEKRSLQAG
jgi:hypothetical protein